jgi:hypothetical protein
MSVLCEIFYILFMPTKIAGAARLQLNHSAKIILLLRSPGIDFKESIPPTYVACWRPGACI